MRSIILFIVAIVLFSGCATKEPEKASMKQVVQKKEFTKNHYYISEFIYKKAQIEFFENEYKNILELDDKKTLEEFANFYKKNASYFKNSNLKVKMLEKRINNLSNNMKKDSHKAQLTKALSSSKKDSLGIYEKLAHEGNIFAQRELAETYKYDNKLKSIFWYKKLIENNDIKSIKDFAFANLHMVNPVVVQDTKRAVELYEKLDSLGEVSGLVHLGNIYEYGYFKNDVPVDKQKSLEYFQKAALKDYTPAQKKLVKIYLCEKCEGDRYNKEKAIQLLNILIAKGDKDSKEILENLNSQEAIDIEEETIKQEEVPEEMIQTIKTEESVE